jgi:cytochrome c-type biogenesis protein CcmH
LTLFILGCAGLVLLSGLFLLIPRRRAAGTDEDLERANLEWFRLRQAELAAEGSEALQDDARLRLLEDVQEPVQAPPATGGGGSFPVWTLFPLVAVASAGLYYLLGAAPDVVISRQLQNLDESGTPAQMESLISAIEARSVRRPDNLDYAALLGRYYMGQQDYHRAARTYAGLARQLPEDAQILAYAAQADYLAAGRQLSEQARLQAEQALAINPHQRAALGLLGMASFEQQQYRGAIAYWQRLLATEPPGSETARMIAGVIETARQRLGESGDAPGSVGAAHAAVADAAAADAAAADAAAAGAAAAGTATAGVTVKVTLPDGAAVAASDTVFVLARNAESDSRMPIAVQRLQAGQLPVTLRLDDRNSMAGQKLSDAASVVVIVQVSPDGRPGEAAATWLGEVGPLAPTMDLEPLEIMLQPRG